MGSRDDLLAGTRRVHPHQLDPDPPRPLRVRQVRQARRRLSVESLVDEIRQASSSTSGQHNIALFGAGNLGQAIASSDIFADHGFRIVAVFDVDPDWSGRRSTGSPSATSTTWRSSSPTKRSSSACSPCPRRRPGSRRPARRGRGADHLQLLRAAARRPARGDRAHVEPCRGPALRALLLLDLSPDRRWLRRSTWRGRASDSRASQDFTVALEEEFALARPARRSSSCNRYEELLRRLP